MRKQYVNKTEVKHLAYLDVSVAGQLWCSPLDQDDETTDQGVRPGWYLPMATTAAYVLC